MINIGKRIIYNPNDFIGLTKENTYGTQMKIIEFNNKMDITVEFQDENKIRKPSTYQNFKRGVINNPYDKTTYGVGYVGVGKYQPSVNKVNTREYSTWVNIMQRCYSESQKPRHEAYWDCTMCEEWFNFQNFATWYEENYYEVAGHRMHLDKDILYKNNKIYSPDTCLVVPQRINMIFIKQPNKYRLPSGITPNISGTYTAHYNGKKLKICDTLEEAIEIHNVAMRENIKQVAEEYKNKIPNKVYIALLNW